MVSDAGEEEQWRETIEGIGSEMIKNLTLSNQSITSEGDLKDFVQMGWPVLEGLTLSYNKISEIGVNFLSKGDWPELNSLSLYSNKIKSAGLAILLHSKFPKLACLSVESNHIDQLPHSEFLGSLWVRNLKKLELSFNNIGSEGAKTLSKSQMPFLQKLSIRGCKIGEQGITHLTKSHWPNLTDFIASWTMSREAIGVKGHQCFSSLSSFKKLEFLQMSEDKNVAAIAVLSLVTMLPVDLDARQATGNQFFQPVRKIFRTRFVSDDSEDDSL